MGIFVWAERVPENGNDYAVIPKKKHPDFDVPEFVGS